MTNYTRREFLKTAGLAGAALTLWFVSNGQYANSQNTVYSERDEIEGKFSHAEPSWKEIRKGLEFSRTEVYRNGEPVDRLGIVKADPEYNSFAVFQTSKNPITIEQWQKATKADVVFNSSYFQDNLDPCGLIMMDGFQKGPKTNKAMKGMFVAEPIDNRRPKAKIIDFNDEQFDYKNPGWKEGVQSFPMLLDEHGTIGLKKSNRRTNRTVVCDDRKDNIIVMTTEGGYFSLYDMGLFLRESNLNIKHAMNMDGGYGIANMMVKTKKVEYDTYGQERQEKIDISIPDMHILLPAVVGIYERK